MQFWMTEFSNFNHCICWGTSLKMELVSISALDYFINYLAMEWGILREYLTDKGSSELKLK